MGIKSLSKTLWIFQKHITRQNTFHSLRSFGRAKTRARVLGVSCVMSFIVKTSKGDPELALYNQLFQDLKDALGKTYRTSEPYESDPDGYIQIDDEKNSIGIAFVAESEEPLTFNIVFESPYSREVSFSSLPDQEQSKIQSIFKTVFNNHGLERKDVKKSN